MSNYIPVTSTRPHLYCEAFQKENHRQVREGTVRETEMYPRQTLTQKADTPGLESWDFPTFEATTQITTDVRGIISLQCRCEPPPPTAPLQSRRSSRACQHQITLRHSEQTAALKRRQIRDTLTIITVLPEHLSPTVQPSHVHGSAVRVTAALWSLRLSLVTITPPHSFVQSGPSHSTTGGRRPLTPSQRASEDPSLHS